MRYYSEYRIFDRTPAVPGQQTCSNATRHAARSGIERLLSEFRDGWRDEATFLELKGDRPVNVRYIALRDGEGAYLGVLEVASWADGSTGG